MAYILRVEKFATMHGSVFYSYQSDRVVLHRGPFFCCGVISINHLVPLQTTNDRYISPHLKLNSVTCFHVGICDLVEQCNTSERLFSMFLV